MTTTLYISYDGMTDPLGQSQVIPYLKGLSNAGFRIVLISFEKKSQHHEIENIKNELASAGILWRPLRYHKSLPATIFDLLIGTLLTIYYCKKYSIKLIHCRGHYLTSLMAYLISPIHKFKYIFDMRGFWADERIEGGIWNNSSPLHNYQYLFFKKMEKIFIKKADQIITLTNVAKEIIEHTFKVKNKIEVIPCSTDTDLFKNSKKNHINEALGKAKAEGKTILVYLGSLGTWYLLDKMFLFFKILKEEKENAVFLFITPEQPESIKKEAIKLGICSRDLILTKASRIEIPPLLREADAGIFFIKPVFSKLGSSPVKHGEMMASSLPVVTNWGIGDVEKIIEESKTGTVLKNWDTESMRNAARELLKLIEKKDRSKYYEAAEKYYSLNLALNKYVKIYSRLTYE